MWPQGSRCAQAGRGRAGRDDSHPRSYRGLARAGPVVSTQGALRSGPTEWWEALVEAKGERALAPVLSVELATLVSKNNKIGS